MAYTEIHPEIHLLPKAIEHQAKRREIYQQAVNAIWIKDGQVVNIELKV